MTPDEVGRAIRAVTGEKDIDIVSVVTMAGGMAEVKVRLGGPGEWYTGFVHRRDWQFVDAPAPGRYAMVKLPHPKQGDGGEFFEGGGYAYVGERGVVRDAIGDCMSAKVARLVAGALVAAADAAEADRPVHA